MANYHVEFTVKSRGKGGRAAEAAAYILREKIWDEYYGVFTDDYSLKKDLSFTQIFLPEDAPYEFQNIQTLCYAIESAERRADSRILRTMKASLPNELTPREHIGLVCDYIPKAFTDYGMCAITAIHEGKNKNPEMNNPHVHVLLTTRAVDRDGFSALKNREWDKRENITEWRKQWADVQNREYERKGLDIRVSHESYLSQGLDREPKKYLSRMDFEQERRGINTERGNENRRIEERNKERELRKQRQQERERDREYSRELEL